MKVKCAVCHEEANVLNGTDFFIHKKCLPKYLEKPKKEDLEG